MVSFLPGKVVVFCGLSDQAGIEHERKEGRKEERMEKEEVDRSASQPARSTQELWENSPNGNWGGVLVFQQARERKKVKCAKGS